MPKKSGSAFGRRLRRLRKAKDLTIDALARKAGVTPLSVKNLEHGKHQPRLPTLLALAGALEVAVAELIRIKSARLPRSGAPRKEGGAGEVRR